MTYPIYIHILHLLTSPIPIDIPIVSPNPPIQDIQDTDVSAQAILIFAATGMIRIGVVALQHVAAVVAAGLNEDEAVHEVAAQILS